MDYRELNQALAALDQAMETLETIYIENGGEVTEEAERIETQVDELQELITKDGIDLLGGWLKAKEDKMKSLKAEKDYISRQMAAIDGTIEFIKAGINHVMASTGQEKIKGDRGYSFTAFLSKKTDVDKDILKDCYANKVEKAIRAAGIPAYIGVSLTASSTKAAEVGVQEGDEDIFVTTEKCSVRFGKPRANKEA